jgi:hypothetical protein
MLRFSRPPLTRRTPSVRPEVALTAFTASSFDVFLRHRRSRRSEEPEPAEVVSADDERRPGR